MEYGIFGLLVLVADIYAIISIISSRASVGAKVIWTLLVLLLPILGFVIWFFVGPRGSAKIA
ncbi:PLDc N-terminal domain-containing protein [Pacificibacter sp. AS14]|uniref:PLDc N-terminal domain-containing protein n=1 Tax=Pacificibacter sp. AS14 TaxID=3135785 RepID=UPI00317C0237